MLHEADDDGCNVGRQIKLFRLHAFPVPVNVNSNAHGAQHNERLATCSTADTTTACLVCVWGGKGWTDEKAEQIQT